MFKFFLALIVISSASFAAQQSENDEVSVLKQKAFKVIKESKGNVIINAPNLATGQKILFVKLVPELDEFETIAQGVVKRSTDKLSLVDLDKDKLVKFPESGDFAVFMGEPKVFTPPPAKIGQEGFSAQAKKVDDVEAGFAQIGISLNQGALLSTSTNRANSYKNMNKYSYQGFSFLWHPDFLPNYGLEFKQIVGAVPVVDYFGVTQDSSLSLSQLRLSYRNYLTSSQFRWKVFIQSNATDFSTLNGDEYVLASKQTALGLGGLVGYEFNKSLPFEATAFYGSPAGIYIEAYYSPNVNVVDSSAVSRGVSSTGSTQLGYAITYTHLFYIEQIPWFKRYFVEFKYATSETKISFQGVTKNPSTNFYTIPENGQYNESETILSVNVGVRLEDWFGKALKPRSK